MKRLHFDCACGAAGDMIVGALIDLGVDFKTVEQTVHSLSVAGFTVSAEKVKKKGVMATQFKVDLDPNEKQPHRHLRHIVEILDKSDLPESVKVASEATFRRIAEAEAEVHGTTVEKVHFHEVGAVDSIVDVVGAHFALHALGVDCVTSSPLHVGSGTVKCAHGIMPVPAPATALLLRGVPSYGGEVEGELVTPTGAALIGQVAEAFGPMPRMNVTGIGSGSGTKDLPDRANILRVFIGESVEAIEHTEDIVVIETNVDDMIPELLPVLVEDLLKAGARDAFLTPVVAKKGRPAHLVTVLCDDAKVHAIAAVLFGSSTTLGLRLRHERRICLAREWRTARTPWGDVRVKIGAFNGTETVASPEFEDCRSLASDAGVPVKRVYEAALAAAVKGELLDAEGVK